MTDYALAWAIAMLAGLMMLLILFTCEIAPAKCIGWCSTESCYNSLSCGFDCFCLKKGSDLLGTCVRLE
jgi:hypothetical protein